MQSVDFIWKSINLAAVPMAETKEELKSHLINVKEETEEAGL